MCETCDELRMKIERYREHTLKALDPLTIERIGKLVSDYEKKLAAMGCPREP